MHLLCHLVKDDIAAQYCLVTDKNRACKTGFSGGSIHIRIGYIKGSVLIYGTLIPGSVGKIKSFIRDPARTVKEGHVITVCNIDILRIGIRIGKGKKHFSCFRVRKIRSVFPHIRCLLYPAFDKTPPVVDLVGIGNRLTGKKRHGKILDLFRLSVHAEFGNNDDYDRYRDQHPSKQDTLKRLSFFHPVTSINLNFDLSELHMHRSCTKAWLWPQHSRLFSASFTAKIRWQKHHRA